jgi:hypothetical protein
MAFCVLNGIVNYDSSKHVIEVSAFDHRRAFCGEPKFSVKYDRCSTPSLKIFSSSQKINSFHGRVRLNYISGLSQD